MNLQNHFGKIKRSVLALVFASLFSIPSFASQNLGGYEGLEFLGSSLISRLELEKILHLRPGATLEAGEKALAKLKLDLEQRHVKANAEIVPDGDSFFVAVDVIETGFNNTFSNRHLDNPRHISIPNEKVFSLLEELKARLQKLADEGRPSSESYQNGIKCFSDVASMRTSELIAQELAEQRPYLLRILATDPNGERRAQTAELLNWTPELASNCAVLIPALDDSDMRVRMAAAKYIWARVSLLPDDFPYDELIEALSRQLSRPSHHDRIRAMAALLAIAKRDSDSISAIKTFDEAKLKEIGDNSVVPSVQNFAKQLLQITANPPPIRRVKRGPSHEDPGTGF